MRGVAGGVAMLILALALAEPAAARGKRACAVVFTRADTGERWLGPARHP